MPSSCAICHSKANKLSSVPKNAAKRKLWEESTGLKFGKFSKICDKHFFKTDYVINNDDHPMKRTRLQPNAVPKPMQNSVCAESIPSELGSQFLDFSSQTEIELIRCGVELENLRLKMRIAELEKENTQLKKTLAERKTLDESLKKIFTNSQIRKLSNGGQRVRWTSEDIAYAICCLHAAGSHAYRFFYAKGFPFPSISSMQDWLREVEVKPGPLNFVFDLIEKDIDLSGEHKICVLHFDEMKIATSEACEKERLKNIEQPRNNYVQVAMVQGLIKPWQQPIYYDYDKPMTISVIYELIEKLYNAGYHVVALVCDMVPRNKKLWSELKIRVEKSWFQHPANANLKVYVFANASHLLKLLRNHFIDSGIIIENKLITVQSIKQVIKHSTSLDLKWKVTKDHLKVDSVERQNVKLAAQLMSNSTANALKHCYELGLEVDNVCETADFLNLVNDWFDLFNVQAAGDNTLPTKQPYGTNKDFQQEVLNRMNLLMGTCLLPHNENCLPFQNGILVSNASLHQLHEYLAEKYNINYLVTSRLSQDLLDQFFETILAKKDLHPTALEFKYRLRKYILSNCCATKGLFTLRE